MKDRSAELVAAVRFLADKGWSPATGGNFSARLDDRHCLITRSGIDKTSLSEGQLMTCTLDGVSVEPGIKPSAETALHTALYRTSPEIGAVLHTHSVHSTVLSRNSGEIINITGYEMQKALAGNTTHAQTINVMVFDNDQDIEALAKRVVAKLSVQDSLVPGFLVRGHGLYAWGCDIAEARRHVEGFEFLFACLWQERLLNS